MRGDEVRAAVERGWRDVAAIDEALARGEIDEAEWYRRQQALIAPKYLAAASPRAQSGHSGDEARWEEARGMVVEALERDGAFLDVGCANGYLMESVVRWAAARGVRVEPFGVDLCASLVALAKRRLPEWRGRFWVGNALDWRAPRRFEFVHVMQLDLVPVARRREMVNHLLSNVCGRGGRLIVGPFNEAEDDAATERALTAWGYALAGKAARAHPQAGVARRVYWVDAA